MGQLDDVLESHGYAWEDLKREERKIITKQLIHAIAPSDLRNGIYIECEEDAVLYRDREKFYLRLLTDCQEWDRVQAKRSYTNVSLRMERAHENSKQRV